MATRSSTSDKCPLGHLITTFQGHSDGINSMALSENGYMLVTGGDDKTGKVWKFKDGEKFRKLGELIGHDGYISYILIVDDYILTGSSDKTVRKWDVENDFKCIVQCTGHSSLIKSIICNGDFIFTSSSDDTARSFDFRTGQCLRVFKGHKGAVHPLLFIPRNFGSETADADVDPSTRLLVTGSEDGTARTWNCDNAQTIKIFKHHTGAVICLATDETNVNLLTGSNDNTIIMWNIATANILKVCTGHENSLICMQVVGDKLYSGSSDGTVREWVYKHGDCSMVMRDHTGKVTCIEVVTKIESQENNEKMLKKRYVFTGCEDKMVRCFDPSTGQLIRLFPGHTSTITSIKVHKERLYSASSDGTIKLWHAFDKDEQQRHSSTELQIVSTTGI